MACQSERMVTLCHCLKRSLVCSTQESAGHRFLCVIKDDGFVKSHDPSCRTGSGIQNMLKSLDGADASLRARLSPE
jgi:hypothetical protein